MAKPWPYDPNIGEDICARISAGEALVEICACKGMPSRHTVYRWLHSTPRFGDSYARARVAQMSCWADEIITIADDATNDYMDRTVNGRTERVLDPENINRSKLRIETRKWIMAKIASKVFGDKIQVDQTARREDLTDDELMARIAATMKRLGIEGPPPVLLAHEPAPPGHDGALSAHNDDDDAG